MRAPRSLRRAFVLLALLAAPLTCTKNHDPRDPAVELLAAAAVGTWSSQNVGTVGATGSWSQSSGVHTVRGAGTDVWSTGDHMRFVYQDVSGDFTLLARVASIQNTNTWAKAGVMVREDLGAGSRNVFLLTSPTASNKYRLQVRAAAGGSTTSAQGLTGTAPVWLKLERAGSTIKAATSPTGASGSWSSFANVTLALNAAVKIGLAVTSHVDATLCTAVFDNVSITTPTVTPPVQMYFEAESGAVTAPMQLAADATASAGGFIQVAPGNNSSASAPATGRAAYSFSVASAALFRLWGRVIAPTNADDSFWVRMDGSATWSKWNGIPLGAAWHWVVVHNGDTPGAPVQFNLGAGNHTLEIAYREDGTRLDRLFLTSDLAATPVDQGRPTVRSVAPVNGATGVSPSAFVSADLIMPNVGGGVDETTMNETTVRLVKTADGTPVPATRNTSGGGDVIVLQPLQPLEAQTGYTFAITDGLKDLTGAAFVPFTSGFSTGDPGAPPPPTIAFDKVALPTATGFTFTSVTIGPDGKLYAATLSGQIVRWVIGADGVTGPAEVITSILAANGGAARAVIGLTFDPAATAENLILWVSHGPAALRDAPDWSGKLSRLTGPALGSVQDVLVQLPRSIKDHMTNSIAFRPGEPQVVYFNQGSMTAMGAPDNAWGQRTEHLLSGAVLRLDTTRLPAQLPLDVKTNDADPTASGYNPFAANAPLTIFASGVRNAYDLVWHSSGSLYVPTNGSAAGGATPATPSPLPSACTRRIDAATAGAYTGPVVPGIATVTVAQSDFLFRVVAGGSYGHPNPFRCEWVLNGGNPTSAVNPAEVVQYPVDTQPDRNWRGNAFDFGLHYSPDGVIEWQSPVFPSLSGKLLVARFSGGDDLIALTIDPVTGNVSQAESGFTGATGFADPLDLTLRASDGFVYVTEHAANKITLLRPRP
jgi:regulation of enolase protein 1 (concanavalin A-like superfamily)